MLDVRECNRHPSGEVFCCLRPKDYWHALALFCTRLPQNVVLVMSCVLPTAIAGL